MLQHRTTPQACKTAAINTDAARLFLDRRRRKLARASRRQFQNSNNPTSGMTVVAATTAIGTVVVEATPTATRCHRHVQQRRSRSRSRSRQLLFHHHHRHRHRHNSNLCTTGVRNKNITRIMLMLGMMMMIILTMHWNTTIIHRYSCCGFSSSSTTIHQRNRSRSRENTISNPIMHRDATVPRTKHYASTMVSTDTIRLSSLETTTTTATSSIRIGNVPTAAGTTSTTSNVTIPMTVSSIEQWERMFTVLCQYEKREGHCNVPVRYKESNHHPALGTWLAGQRTQKRQGTLHDAYQQRLEDLGVVWDLQVWKWDKMLALLQQYKDREGHCAVPARHTEATKNLGHWLVGQRARKKAGRLSTSEERRLVALGMVWQVRSSRWEAMFALLVTYKDMHGDLNIPRNYTASQRDEGDDNSNKMEQEFEQRNLGTWLIHQRYLRNQGKLAAAKQNRLEELGLVWHVQSKVWEDMFLLLVDYKKREGHCNVPGKHTENNENLGKWLSSQRNNKNRDKLNKDYQHRLEELGVVWNTTRISVSDLIQKQQQTKDGATAEQQEMRDEGNTVTTKNENTTTTEAAVLTNDQRSSNEIDTRTDFDDDDDDGIKQFKELDDSSRSYGNGEIQEVIAQPNRNEDGSVSEKSILYSKTVLDYNTNSRWVDNNVDIDDDDDVDYQEETEPIPGHDEESKISNLFEITSPYEPMGDQPAAISKLVKQIKRGDEYSVLKGCTGTGKTFVMAQVIAQTNKPALILCHNKSLAAQLARELQSHLGNNHIRLFVSYYNHYRPEYYDPTHNKYGAKKSSVNDELDALRHFATESLLQHKDVVVVASVSCIYGLGMPQNYKEASVTYTVGDNINVGNKPGVRNNGLDTIQTKLESLLYATPEQALGGDTKLSSDEEDLGRGCYYWSYNNKNQKDDSAQTGTVASLMIWPPSERYPVRIDFEQKDSQQTQSSSMSEPQSTEYSICAIYHGHTKGMIPMESTTIFPAKHHIAGTKEEFEEALTRIYDEMVQRHAELRDSGKRKEADRLLNRVTQDLALMRETGSCPGVENYSRHIALKDANEPPATLLEYFRLMSNNTNSDDDNDKSIINNDWLLVMDESHVTMPQLKAMYGGDRARKEVLVEHGYRLPSALDNRPLRHDEFWERVPQTMFVSATPSQREIDLLSNIDDNRPVDMMIRPTFVCDPIIDVRPIDNQLGDLVREITDRSKRNERTLAITVTKLDAEDLCTYLINHGGILAMYIHSGLNTHERSSALQALQSGEIDCLVGVNLLREGLDLPQVSLVAILNADFEGFLRSETALLQTIGRAARNKNGKAIFYANKMTNSMHRCIKATECRRKAQLDYNLKNNKQMCSTEGSSTQSIFDLLKDQIDAGKQRKRLSVKAFEDPIDTAITASALEIGSATISSIHTDHLPSKPGVYFWKDKDRNILYIGKAKKLRSRVKSYLNPGAKHNSRIRTMIQKAHSIEFILTPSDRDALILEDKLIKHHQPLYNVLLKDDESYPYLCATVGDEFPSFTIVPRKLDGDKTTKYRYFGPYPHFSEIKKILEEIEEKYSLRSIAFQARHGKAEKSEYQQTFLRALDEIFDSEGKYDGRDGADGDTDLVDMRTNFEEASKLFDSDSNRSRDVVAVGKSDDGSMTVVYVLQLRDGMVTGQFSYNCEVASELQSEEELADAMQRILESYHYPSGATPIQNNRSFFPSEILVQYPLSDIDELKDIIQTTQKFVEPSAFIANKKKKRRQKLEIRKPATRGARKMTDQRAIQCAIDNAIQVANQKAMINQVEKENVPMSSVDGTAMKGLTQMLALEKDPRRIECYDISHTQGENTVGSRVVFIEGRPVPSLYRKFNIQTVMDGKPDDYQSLEEVLERRFRRVWKTRNNKTSTNELVDDKDPWSMPDLVVIDGGKGQLNAAVKGISRANVLPYEPIHDDSGQHSFSVSDEDKVSSNNHDHTSSTIHGDWIVEEEEDDDDDSDSTMFVESSLSSCKSESSSTRTRGAFVPIIALAKKKEEVFVYRNSNPVNTNTSIDDGTMLLLRSLRDESHRFAITSMRKRRRKMNGGF